MTQTLLCRRDRKYFYTICCGAICLGLVCNFTPTTNLYSNLITFISILTGFQITSFAMLFSSSIVKGLYKIKDNENSYITLKHRLKNYYKFAFNLALLSIVIIFILEIFKPNHITTPLTVIDLSWIGRSAVFSIIASNIFANYKTMNMLYKIFIQNND